MIEFSFLEALIWGGLLLGQARGQSPTTSFRPIFTVPASADVGAPLLPNIQDPQAVDPQSVCPGYIASNAVSTGSGLTAQLSLAGKACNVYGTDIDSLTLTVEYQAKDRLHVEMVPTHLDGSNTSYYILPDHLIRKPSVDSSGYPPGASDLNFTWTNDATFSFTVTRQSTGDVLFSTAGKKLVFEDQFIEFGTDLPEDYNLYGLGDVVHALRLGNNLTRTLYNADIGDNFDANLYGTHPFYLETRYYNGSSGANYSSDTTTSRSHGVYLRNAHGQEVLLRPQNVTWRTIGGSIDLYFFAGPTALEVTKSYQRDAIGLPTMQQYFTFGYHQCRWGYHNWSELQDVVDNFQKFEIPLETIWNDIDYMNQYRDFENDQNTYPYGEGQQFLQRLHQSGRHYVPIIDSAIYVPNSDNSSDAYAPFENGNSTGSFLKNPDGSLYIGDVWPGYTVFGDWLSSGAGAYWTHELVSYHEKIAYDGIWIDMSEASSFCVGSCGSKNLSLNPVHPSFSLPGEFLAVNYEYPEAFNVSNATEAATASSLSSSQAAALATSPPESPSSTIYLRTTPTPGVRNINYPPYTLNNAQGADLAVHAVSPNATHADGTVEYDVHNLFGHQILNATYYGLLSVFPGKRPFIIGRSTFAGSGVFAGHWGGDNYSKWAYMYFSIPQLLSFSLLGIPMFGVDTCGFSGNTDMELCNRWMQLSAFFPFYRNHNVLAALPQEPYRWQSVTEATKKAMSIRYSLLPYIYTLFYQAHETGSLVARALAWEFPNDPSLAAVDRQFLLGPSILITPVLTPLAATVDGVFPGVGEGEVWYDWYTQMAVEAKAGENKTIDAPLGHIPVYIRGGSVVPTQEPGMTTKECRMNPWGILTALDGEGKASGELYVDDGESLTPTETLFVKLTAESNHLNATVSSSSDNGLIRYNDTNPMGNITIMGVAYDTGLKTVSLNDQGLEGSQWTYNATSKVLVVNVKDLTTKIGGAWKSDWSLSWSM